MAGGGGGLGNSQIINGQTYQQYTPQWYNAMAAEQKRQAVAGGSAAGSGAGTALSAEASTAPPGLFPGLPGSVPGGSSGGGLPPTVGTGSLQGLQLASALPGGGGAPGVSGGAYGSAGGPGGGPGDSGVQTIAPVDTSAATQAQFQSAKDQVGQETQGALTGLRSALGGRGMLGSGAEYRGTQLAAQAGQEQLGETTRAGAETAVQQKEAEALANQQAGVTQRGQDITAQTARTGIAAGEAETGYTGQITQRGQDIQAQEAANNLTLAQATLANTQRAQSLSGLLGALNLGSTVSGAGTAPGGFPAGSY